MSTFKVQVVDAGDSPFRNGDTFDVDYDNGSMMNMKQRNAKVSGSVNANNVDAFRQLYKEAKEKGKTVFVFENQQVLTEYARFLLEYVETIKAGYGKSKQ